MKTFLKFLVALFIVCLLSFALYFGWRMTVEHSKIDAWNVASTMTRPPGVLADDTAREYIERVDEMLEVDRQRLLPRLAQYKEWREKAERFKAQQHMRLLFLDRDYRNYIVDKSDELKVVVNQYPGFLTPDEVIKSGIVRSWMDWRSGRALSPEEFDAACKDFITRRMGRDKADRYEIFEYVEAHFDQVAYDDSVERAAEAFAAPRK